MKIAGIDPSMNSSGKVIMDLDDTTLDIKSVDYYGYSSHLCDLHEEEHVHIYPLGTDYTKQSMAVRMDRAYTILAKDMEDVRYIAFEDYAYDEANKQGSNSIFQIGEFCGGLRYFFYMMGKGIITYGIPQIKHFATGSGGAHKPEMCQSVKEHYPEFYYPYLETLTPQYESPHSDLCDAFWMCEILRNHIKYDVLGPDSLSDETLGLMLYTSSKRKKGQGIRKDSGIRALVDYDLILRSEHPFDIETAGKRKTSSRKSAKNDELPTG